MARIAIERAPPTAVPRRFLLSAPCWGMLAGALLAVDDGSGLASRWSPAALALVHALTLGMLGNALFGSLLQFVPAAVGARIGGRWRHALALHALLNLGTLGLVVGFHAARPRWLLPAAGLLAVAIAGLVAMLLPGLSRVLRGWLRSGSTATGRAPPVLPLGLDAALSALLVAVALGLLRVLALNGWAAAGAPAWVDLHAGWAGLGWVLGLLASVGAVVLPMFQGTAGVPPWLQLGWLATLWLGLLLATGGMLAGLGPLWLRGSSVAVLALFSLAALWLQWRAPHPRNRWLVRSWRLGLLALLAAAGVLSLQGPSRWFGALLLAIGLPALLAGMQLEIAAFLGWIELQRRSPRRRGLPTLTLLLPERDKASVFILHALFAVSLLLALRWPLLPLQRLAGGLWLLSQALLGWRMAGVGRRCRAHLEGIADGAVATP